MWFDDWQSVWRAVWMGSCGYVAMIILLRASGKRTLSKMNMFDFVVTIAFGSILATLILSRDVSLVEGIAGVLVLILGQYVITFLSVRFPLVERLVKADPVLLYFRGRPLPDVLRRERVTREEMDAAVREAGVGRLDLHHAVVLETNGTLTVIDCAEGGLGGSLNSVRHPEGVADADSDLPSARNDAVDSPQT